MKSEKFLAGVVFLAIPTALWFALYSHHPDQAIDTLKALGVFSAVALVAVTWIVALLTLFGGRPSDQ